METETKTETKTETPQSGEVVAQPSGTEATDVPSQQISAEEKAETLPVETVAEVEVKEEKSLLSCASCSAVDTSTSALLGVALLLPLIIKHFKRI